MASMQILYFIDNSLIFELSRMLLKISFFNYFWIGYFLVK